MNTMNRLNVSSNQHRQFDTKKMQLLFISGSGRSGTTLLRDLLDGHPEIAVWPNEWQFLTLYKKHVSSNLNQRFSVGDILACLHGDVGKFTPVLKGTIVDHRERNTPSKFPALNPYFAQKLYQQKNNWLNAKEFYYLVANSYRWQDSQYIFCNKCNDPENILDYVSHFREASFVFMLRDPISTYISKLKYRSRGKSLTPADFAHNTFTHTFIEIKELFKSLKFLQESADFFKNILVMKLEDLRSDSTRCLDIIMDFLNIKYNDSLTSLTAFGSPISGNFIDPRNKNNKLVSVDKTVNHDNCLTAKEKEWFLHYKEQFRPFYPDIEDRVNNTPTVNVYERSYMYFKEYQQMEEKQFLKIFSALFDAQS